MKCFLSRSFRPEDKIVTDWFREFLLAFPRMKILEARDEPRPPLEQVKHKISQCQMLCAVITSRNGAVPQWVSTEIGMAHSLGKPIFAFVEDGIADLGGLKNLIEFKTFSRKTLGRNAPEYIRYTFAVQSMVSDADTEWRQRVEKLTAIIQILEDNRDRYDDL
jgi:hypothetical protein